MTQIRGQSRDGEVTNVWVSIPLRPVVENKLSQQGRTGRTTRFGVVSTEHIGAHVVGVDGVVPPLSDIRVGTLKVAREGIWRAEEAGIEQFDGFDTDGSSRGRERRVGVQRIQIDLDVAESMEAIGTDLGAILAAELVQPGIWILFDGDLSKFSISYRPLTSILQLT